jgi:uncharacterized phage-like protein YoqJ
MMRVVVTGHRPKQLPGGYNWGTTPNQKIMVWMRSELHALRQTHGEVETATGMALGTDQMFAQCCIHEEIPFHAFIPCKGQDAKWFESSRNVYNWLLDRAASITMVSDKPYTPSCMQVRNEAMRDWALKVKDNLVLAVWDGGGGGTSNMIRACQKFAMDIKVYEPSTTKVRDL